MVLVVWELCPRTSWFPQVVLLRSPWLIVTLSSDSRSFYRLERSEGLGKNLVSRDSMKLRRQTKKVIMRREFLLVSRHFFQDLDKRFHFYHMSGLSTVDVEVKEPSLMVSHLCSPNGQMSREGYVEVLEGDNPSIGVPDLVSPCRMEVVGGFPSSLTSCVTASLTSDCFHLSVEDSVYDRDSTSNRVGDDFQDSALGSRNLRAKRILAFWCFRLEDRDHGLARLSTKQKRTKIDRFEGSNGCIRTFTHPTRRKWKWKKIIEDDPHFYRVPHQHVFR